MSQAAGLVGYAVAGPAVPRLDVGLLQRVLGEVEVAEPTDQARKHQAVLVAKHVVQDGRRCTGRRRPPQSGHMSGSSMTGRTSMEPNRASGIFAAQSSASSRESALIT